MLPTVTRTAEVVLRLVPGGLREASLALGGGEWATVRRVVLPTARTGPAHRGDPRRRAHRRRDRAAASSRRSATRRSTPTRSTTSRTRCRCSSTSWSASRRPRRSTAAWTGALVLLGARARAVRHRPDHRRSRARAHRADQARCDSHERVSHDLVDTIDLDRTRTAPRGIVADARRRLADRRRQRLVRRPQGARARRRSRCAPNQVTALIGPSGCGKSTFLRILNRMHELVPGASLAGTGRARRHRHLPVGAARHRDPPAHRHGVPEAEPVPGDDGRRERASPGSKLARQRSDRDETQHIVETLPAPRRALERGEEPARRRRAARSPAVSSSGCASRARSRCSPTVLLMDEPCSALDPTSTRRIEETIAELARAGDDRDRHAQHAAGAARLAALRVLPRGRERARATSSSRARPRRCSPSPTTPARSTTSPAGSDDERRMPRSRSAVRRAWRVAAVVPSCATRRRTPTASINGAGSTWSADRGRPVAGRRRRARASRSTTRASGSTAGRVFYYQDQVDFAVSEIPFTPAYRDASGTVSTNEVALAAHRPYAYLPDRRRRHVVHVPPRHQRAARHEPAPLARRRSPRSSPASSRTGTTPRSSPTTRGVRLPSLPITPGRPLRRFGNDRAVHRVHGEPDARHRGTRSASAVGINVNPCPSMSLWPDLNALVAAVLRRCRRLRRRAVQQRRDHLRGVRLRASSAASRSRRCSTRPATTRSRPPHNVAIALAGATLNADGTQNLERRLHVPRPAHVSGVELQLHDRADDHRRAVQRGQGRDARASSSCTSCAPDSRRPRSSATRRCPKNLVQFAFDAVNKIPGHVGAAADRPVRQPDDHGRLRHRRRAAAAAERPAGRDPDRRLPGRDRSGGSGRNQRRQHLGHERQWLRPFELDRRVPDHDHDETEGDDHHVDHDQADHHHKRRRRTRRRRRRPRTRADRGATANGLTGSNGLELGSGDNAEQTATESGR